MILTDGNSEYITNSSMDTYVLETSAARVRRRAKIVGLLVPNKQGTQRIAKLMSIVTGPNDAIDPANFARTTADNIAKLIAFRVKRWIKPGETSSSFIRTFSRFPFVGSRRPKRTGPGQFKWKGPRYMFSRPNSPIPAL